MYQKLQNLRPSVRKLLMVSCIVVSSLAIFLFWLNSFKTTFKNNSQNEIINNSSGNTATMPSLKQTLSSGLAGILNTFKTGKEKIQNNLNKTDSNSNKADQDQSQPTQTNQDNQILEPITPHQLP